jgi:hypothetical protein
MVEGGLEVDARAAAVVHAQVNDSDLVVKAGIVGRVRQPGRECLLCIGHGWPAQHGTSPGSVGVVRVELIATR